MRRGRVVAFNRLQVISRHSLGELIHLLIEAAYGFVLLYDGLIKRLSELL